MGSLEEVVGASLRGRPIRSFCRGVPPWAPHPEFVGASLRVWRPIRSFCRRVPPWAPHFLNTEERAKMGRPRRDAPTLILQNLFQHETFHVSVHLHPEWQVIRHLKRKRILCHPGEQVLYVISI